MIEYSENSRFLRIRCDKCEKPSPPTDDLIVNNGLIGMGWYCLGGKHVCPDCRDDT